jgi:hypothetical protein
MLSKLRDTFDAHFEAGAIRRRKLAAIDADARCPVCRWTNLLRFSVGSDNWLAFPRASTHGGADYFCPTCRRLFEVTDIDNPRLDDVTLDWVQDWTGMSYCTRCTGSVRFDPRIHPPTAVCQQCGHHSAVDLDEMRTAALVDHYGVSDSTHDDHRRLLEAHRAQLPPHP